MKVFIWGSCVSRDCFNYPSSSSFDLVKYHARCSCVSAMSKPVSLIGINLDKLSSKFKRQAIIDDFNKQLIKDLKTIEFDILLIDFIDERFSLKINNQGNIITISAELQETGFVSLDGKIVHIGDEEKFYLWNKSWNKFIDFCKKNNIKDKIVINCARWANYMENGEIISSFTQKYIDKNNKFLEKIYNVIKEDIPEYRCIRYSDEEVIANSKHRWGISPFHYIDTFYEHTNKYIKKIYSIPICLNDRIYKSFETYKFKYNNKIQIVTNGKQENYADKIRISFTEIDKYYYLRAILPNKFYGNGIAITFRIIGWQEGYHYSLGYVYNGKQYKVNGKHLIDGKLYTVVCAKNDIVYNLDNSNIGDDVDLLNDIRFIIFGEFKNKAIIEIKKIYIWEEIVDWNKLLKLKNNKINDNKLLLNRLADYIRESNPDADKLYENFYKNGSMPINNKINIPWQAQEIYPDHFWDVGTFSWSWLCLHPVQLCTLRAYDKKDIGALCAAREFAAMWLDHFFCKKSYFPYEWHEHAAAERTISLLFLYLLGQEYSFDWRFMSRIKIAVVQHARLLSSEAFYVRHQRTRFHNHGMFQDMALLLAGLIFTELPGAEYWRNIGIDRLKDMLNVIYPTEGDFRISYENSFGYHCAGYTIFEKLARLISYSEGGGSILHERSKKNSGLGGCTPLFY